MRYITSDLAKVLGVTTNTIRRYEKSGFLSPKRDSSNYRYYEDFDITKTANVRLYVKCGFSHEEIEKMFNKSDEEIMDIYERKLLEMEKEAERLKRLHHWLKDNLALIHTAKRLDDEFVIMDCPAIKFCLYSSNSEILTEKGRLETLKKLLYEVPEVQVIQIFKLEDLKKHKINAYKGWALKEMDIEKFHLAEYVEENNYIETFPSVKCLYHTMRIPSNLIYNHEEVLKASKEYFEKINAYMQEHNLEQSGDIVQYYVNTVGKDISLLISIPVIEKEER